MVKNVPRPSVRSFLLILLAVLYAGGASLACWNVVVHSQSSTLAIEKILKTYNLRNEGEKTLDSYTRQHPFLGMFLASPVKQALELPSAGESAHALHVDVEHDLKDVRVESSKAAWWSWCLLSISLIYVVTLVAVERSHNTRPVIFGLTTISLAFLAIGILAPAMVIWTAPAIPMPTGELNFVVQHQVRSVGAVIVDLFSSEHEIIGVLLLLFGVLVPLAKASLTYIVTLASSKGIIRRVGELLITISKWSMADVLVAAILLALYALKFQEATKSIPCLGIYYFIGYCFVTLMATELLARSGVTEGRRKPSNARLGFQAIGGLLVGVFCIVAASSLYTYRQYTENTKGSVSPSASPDKLNNADLVLPGHK